MFARRKVDPELEKLRNEVQEPPNLDTIILNIQKISSRIHAAYLFQHIGKAMLQKLCLLLSSTATGKIYDGWQEFAAHMGLTMEQIQCIDYDLKGLQDSTYYVLLTYVQSPEATMDKIFSTLQKMQRLDIINQIKDYLYDLIDAVSQCAKSEGSEIIQPEYLPRAPLVLSPILTETKEMKENKLKCLSQDTQQKDIKQKYGCIVMLTFANDGLPTAESIKKIFRSKQPRIGVLILQEQEKGVYSRAEEFVDDCFKQIDYIIPILTRGYIERINNLGKTNEEIHNNNLDEKYLKYIYSLLRYEYLKNQCCNNRVRCIVPDKDVYTVIQANLHPTLQAWFRESDIESFVNNILFHKF